MSAPLAARRVPRALIVTLLVSVAIGLYIPLILSPGLQTEMMELEAIAAAAPGGALAYAASPDSTRPLANIALYTLLRLTGSAGSVRLAAALLHGLSVALLFALIRALLGSRREDEEASLLAPATGALLFAIHPVATEAVAAHGAFPIVLGAALGIASLLLAARAAEEPVPRLHASAGLLLAALLCEASLWPFALLAPALARKGGAGDRAAAGRRSRILMMAPYAGSVALFYVSWIARAWPSIQPFPGSRIWSVTGGIASQSAAFLTELRLLLFPAGLSLDHFDAVYDGRWSLQAICGAVLLAVLLLAAFWKGLDRRLARVFIALLALPHLHWLLFPPADPLQERRIYITLAGAALAAAAAARLIESRAGARIASACAILVMFPFLLVAAERARLWREPLELWKSSAAVNPASPRSRLAMANLHLAERRLDAALQEFEAARDLAPGNVAIQTSIAEVHFERRDYEAAIREADKAVAIDPSHVPAYLTAGNSYMAQNRPREAFLAFNAALLRDADNPSALFNMGALMFQQGRFGQAVDLLEQAADLRPEDPDILFRLGMGRLNVGDLPGAGEAFRACLRAEPGRSDAGITLATVLTQQDEHEEARELLERIVAAEPESAQALNGLAVLASARNDWEEARLLFERAVEADPGDLRILYNLAGALERVGERDAAIRAYRKFTEEWSGSLDVSEDARMRLERLEQEGGG